ncbi:coiled-coil and C2 domain-containing protein 1A [Striga asiatica]|uniref:Coiled-coil and C2 domain-containing protein 1A n=1 Tax=Striga asiatica TaxID=4170 RepID=A0A5A7PIW4_STRAF|nr:coiled-coil and C2 domain-containing protein 1A [Striga asiatica]
MGEGSGRVLVGVLAIDGSSFRRTTVCYTVLSQTIKNLSRLDQNKNFTYLMNNPTKFEKEKTKHKVLHYFLGHALDPFGCLHARALVPLQDAKYWALALNMRRALSSDNGFLGSLCLGFGLSKSRDYGSSLREQRTFGGGSFERIGGGFTANDGRKEDYREILYRNSTMREGVLRRLKT